MLYIRASELSAFITENLHSLTYVIPFPPPSSTWKLAFYSFSMKLAFLKNDSHICDTIHYLSFSD